MMPSIFQEKTCVTASALEKKVEGYLKQLAEETGKVKQSAFFQEYLDVMAKFWDYSFHNQILIYIQSPSASRVAGFKTWNNLGRQIKAGKRAIKILAPFTKKVMQKDKETGEEKEVGFTYFCPVNVFDVSQTIGEELPKIDIGLVGDSHNELLQKLLGFCKQQNIIVEFKQLEANFYGYSTGGKIILNTIQSVNMQVNTLVHEIAHELIHYSPEAKNFSKTEKETQAESTAYVICKFFGLETKSPEYLAFYKASPNEFSKNLKTISTTSQKILGSLC